MLYALTDGLAGIEDLGRSFDEVRLSPRWPAAQVANAEVSLRYESSGVSLGYEYSLSDTAINMVVSCPKTMTRFHVLLPGGVRPARVTVAGRDMTYEVVPIRQSRYVDFTAGLGGEVKVAISFS